MFKVINKETEEVQTVYAVNVENEVTKFLLYGDEKFYWVYSIYYEPCIYKTYRKR